MERTSVGVSFHTPPEYRRGKE
ncbi:uncharacterized protein G2W53_037178 [Senna tora]|uniref:Uncharacterized protein n=1 Tax=Senna tora TaxID=362788 RepID=A0A834SX28_9FABA|nr:uncharacterized protein G2W53_037178 [Senna tora]